MNTISAEELARLISEKCAISFLSNNALINCCSLDDYVLLVQQRKIIKEALSFIFASPFFSIEQVTIGITGTAIRQSFPLHPGENQVQIILPVNNLINECLSFDGACGIVRMSDHKGLFSNEKIVLSSNAHPNDWVGKDMSDYWIKEELEKYLERLNKDKELRNYSYVAKLMTGETARLTVDARLVNWRGEPARIVKTISREILT